MVQWGKKRGQGQTIPAKAPAQAQWVFDEFICKSLKVLEARAGIEPAHEGLQTIPCIRLDTQRHQAIFSADDISVAVIRNQRDIQRALVQPIRVEIQAQALQIATGKEDPL
jgi:hypothetical protein